MAASSFRRSLWISAARPTIRARSETGTLPAPLEPRVGRAMRLLYRASVRCPVIGRGLPGAGFTTVSVMWCPFHCRSRYGQRSPVSLACQSGAEYLSASRASPPFDGRRLPCPTSAVRARAAVAMARIRLEGRGPTVRRGHPRGCQVAEGAGERRCLQLGTCCNTIATAQTPKPRIAGRLPADGSISTPPISCRSASGPGAMTRAVWRCASISASGSSPAHADVDERRARDSPATGHGGQRMITGSDGNRSAADQMPRPSGTLRPAGPALRSSFG